MLRAHVLTVRRPKLYHIVSGIVTLCKRPSGAQVETVLSQPVQGTATYRCDDTGGCMVQFWPPEDENVCSKHVEA